MNLQATGRLIVKYDTQQVTDKFKKREFVIETTDQVGDKIFTTYSKFQLSQAKCDILDGFNVGDTVTVSFNLKGFKWEKDGKVSYINTLDAWKIERVGVTETHVSTSNNYNPAGDQADDLPF